MRAGRLLVAALALCVVACRSESAPAPAASSRVEPPPAPASLVAELSVGNPKETWAQLRLLGGNLANALPTSLPVLFATSLSLPPDAAGSIDEAVPMVGALLSRPDSTEPDAVVGVHVVSGAELTASLTLGSSAKFRSVQLAPRLVRLVAAPGAAEPNGALGISGNYLLIASRVEALKDAGRFVAEGVSKRARSRAGLSLRASEQILHGALSQRLRALWQAQRTELAARDRALREEKGRAPDFADPAVLLGGADSTIESWLAVLESSRELELSLTPEATRFGLELSLTPSAEGAAALLARELPTGPLAPLLALPQSTAVGLSLRGDAAPTAEASEAFGKSLVALFGERVTPQESAKLVQRLAALARARHGATTLGFAPAPRPALIITCQVADAEAFQRVLGDALGLLELPPVSAWLSGKVGKPSLQLGQGASGARQARIRLKRPVGDGPALTSLSLSWEASDGVATVVVSPDDAVAVGSFHGVTKLGASPFLERAERDWGDQAALGVFANARLVAPGGPDDAPALLVVGKRQERIAVSIDLSPGALRALLRVFGLDRSL